MGISEDKSNPADFLNSLTDFSKQHRAQRWEGSLGDFLTQILPVKPLALVRTSHEYIWDMLLWYGRDVEGNEVQKARELFKRELFALCHQRLALAGVAAESHSSELARRVSRDLRGRYRG